MPLAPIAIFAFRRPHHLQRTLLALAANVGARDHDVVAFIDGPRHSGDLAGVLAVRQVMQEWSSRGAFRSFSIEVQPSNLGLRTSLCRGVSRVCADAGSVIVVEDDLETSPWFLEYCRNGLATYEKCEQVGAIHGYCYPVSGRQSLPETFFIRGADCWGWATWRRAWSAYQDDTSLLISRLYKQGLNEQFTMGGARATLRMLAEARDGRIDSWAIRWHASAFLAGLYTLYPGRSLVRNIGFDDSGTHCAPDPRYDVSLATSRIDIVAGTVAEDPISSAALAAFFRTTETPSLMRRAYGRLLRSLRSS